MKFSYTNMTKGDSYSPNTRLLESKSDCNKYKKSTRIFNIHTVTHVSATILYYATKINPNYELGYELEAAQQLCVNNM